MTILHLISLRGMGGRAATALRQARLLAGRGHRVLVGCLPGTWAEQKARELGLTVCNEFHFQRGFRPLRFWSDCRNLARRCNEEQVEIIHAHVSQESWVACLGARMAKRPPAVVRSRGVVVPVKPHLFNRWLHNRWTARVVTPSKVIRDHLNSLPGFDQAKVRCIPDGVDVERFGMGGDGASIRTEFNIPASARVILMVARLERVKGHEVFFGALAQLAKHPEAPEWRALCACDERTPGAFEATVARAKVLGLAAPQLQFTGMRKDIEKFYAAAAVVALPSLGSEGSSRVALEAAAAGVPVVASSVGCLPETIEDAKTGRIVPSNDPTALAAALLELLRDPRLSRELGLAARKRAETLYDERSMIEKLEALYQESQ
jgi:glycosyltransferase involved in cell wall biosynthesis